LIGKRCPDPDDTSSSCERLGPVTAWEVEVRKRIDRGLDACIAVVGYTGNGKSTLAWQLARRFGPWDGSGMCFSPDEVWSALHNAKRGDVVVVDEGVEVVYSLDTATRESRDFVRWLDVCRARGVILFVLMANLRWMNARIREDRALWAFSVRRPGTAILYRRIGADPMALDGEGGGTFRATGIARFPKVTGPDWDAYMQRKDDRVTGYDPAAERERRRAERPRRRRKRATAEG